jgi:hypothetical protein
MTTSKISTEVLPNDDQGDNEWLQITPRLTGSIALPELLSYRRTFHQAFFDATSSVV